MAFVRPLPPTIADDLGNLMPALPEHRLSTEQFEEWAFTQEWKLQEWVDGDIVVMAPFTNDHANISRWLLSLVTMFVEERELGRTFVCGYMTRLARSWPIPDLMFLGSAGFSRITPNHLDGPPDLAVETVSADSAARDWREKYLEYEAAGVGEYWVIDPTSNAIECYALGADRRFHPIPVSEERIMSTVLPGFYLRPAWLWQKPLPRVAPLLREMGIAF